MPEEKPLILITNDDGYRAKGIKELTDCLREVGELVVFAPDRGRSGMGSAITSLLPIRYTLVSREKGLTVYSCSGTPVDCVKLSLDSLLTRKPDLLVAGINHGGNMAIAVNYSGTMGAVAEGCIRDIPSLGISSLNHSPEADFTECCRLGRQVVRQILRTGLPVGTYLNLNVPTTPHVKGIKVCRQARGRWENEFMRSETPNGEDVFWLTGEYRDAQPTHPENDTLALNSGYASLVPCKIDITDYAYLQTLRDLFER
ncbi:MAG: 5'/3'-nucleotidase SurE [Tannerellaceae bacterium]|jgi:5'-nucleotidase|nr:5'/3'-nucleotidase SurE [Tannerellaceae bacterium]